VSWQPAPLENAVLIELTQPLIFIAPTKICLHLAQNLSMPRHYLLTKSKRPKCSENKVILIKVTFYFRNGYIISSTLHPINGVSIVTKLKT